MNTLSRIVGRVVDRATGLPPAVPYAARPDVAVPMPDGVVLLGDHYRPAGHDRPLPVVLTRSPYGRAGSRRSCSRSRADSRSITRPSTLHASRCRSGPVISGFAPSLMPLARSARRAS